MPRSVESSALNVSLLLSSDCWSTNAAKPPGPLVVQPLKWTAEDFAEYDQGRPGHRGGDLGDVVGLADDRGVEADRRAGIAVAGGEDEGHAAGGQRLGDRDH